MMKGKTKNRLLAGLLVLVMVLGLLPAAALAAPMEEEWVEVPAVEAAAETLPAPSAGEKAQLAAAEPTLGAGQHWVYMSFTTGTPNANNGWGTSEEPYPISIYPESATSKDNAKVAEMAPGTYKLWSGNRWMHVDDSANKDKTNQCQGNEEAPHEFLFEQDAEGWYTIKSVASTSQVRYVNVGTVGSYAQLPCTETPTKFAVEQVAGQEGVYYIKAAAADPDAPFEFKPIESVGDNQRMIYAQVTEPAGVVGDGSLYVVVMPTGTERTLYAGDTTTNQYTTTVGEDQVTLTGDTTTIINSQLWGMRPTSGGYQIISYQNNKYLTTTASGNQLALSTTGSVFTVEAGSAAGTLRLKSGNKYLTFVDGSSRGWKMADTAADLKLFHQILVNFSDLEMAQTVFKGTSDKPMDRYYIDDDPDLDTEYRIPALITLNNGWIVAASDIRWPNTDDSPNNLDTIVSISKDGGQNWDWEIVNYFSDFAPLSGVETKVYSASFIDPALAVDGNGDLWMAVDLQPTHVNLRQNGQKTGSGFDENGLLMAAPISEAEWETKVNNEIGRTEATRLQYQAYYEYRVDINSVREDSPATTTTTKNGKTVTLFPIFHKDTKEEAGVYVDAFFDLYCTDDDGAIQPVLVPQKESSYITQANLFYIQSPWKAYSTTYLMVRKATVNEEAGTLDWGDPRLVSGVKNFDGETFLAFCPGRGTVITLGDGTERILFPVYDNVNGEKSSAVYSDDGGVTWHRGQRIPNGNAGKTSESQIVELPGKTADGTPVLRFYSRNTQDYISYADSYDGGVTWTGSQKDNALKYGNNVMVSFINLEGYLEDPEGNIYENLLLASYPWGTIVSGEHNRSNGVVRIGSVGTDENYTVTWLNSGDAWEEYMGRFNYSCLTQYRDENNKATDEFGLLYEKDAGSGHMEMLYFKITVEDLLGAGWTLKQYEPPVVYTYEVAPIANQSYTGSPIEPAVTVLRDGEAMESGYTLAYTGNVNVGTATVTVLVAGEEVATGTFQIVPPRSLGRVTLTASPEPVVSGGELTLTLTGVQSGVEGLSLTMDGAAVDLTAQADGTYTGKVTAPTGLGRRDLRFSLTAPGYETVALTVTVNLIAKPADSGNTPGGNTSGGSNLRPTGGNASQGGSEELDDPDVPLAQLPSRFQDVKASDWYYKAVEYVTAQNMMVGVSETNFAPYMNTSRGMIVTILYRMEREPAVNPTSFMDVAGNAWFAKSAAWGAATGVVKGTDNGMFNATADVTREQLAVFLYRFAAYRGYNVSIRGGLNAFRDAASTSAWARDAMQWAVGAGLIQGQGGLLRPTATATRAEVAVTLMRFCQNIGG